LPSDSEKVASIDASQVLDQPQRIVDRGVRIARRDGIADPK
jgi:hypothetical protein